MSSITCSVCRKPAVPAEQLSLDDLVVHKKCFNCSTCQQTLNRSKFFKKNDLLFCKNHFDAYEQQSRRGGSAASSSAPGTPRSSPASASQTFREQGNQKLALYQEADGTEAFALLDQARNLYQKALKAAENNDDASSALHNLCLVMRASSFILFGWKKIESGCEAVREALRLAEEAFEVGRDVKPQTWIAKLRKSSIDFAEKIADEHSEILHRMCPLLPTCFAEHTLRAAAERMFKIAIVRMDVRQTENERASNPAEDEDEYDEDEDDGEDEEGDEEGVDAPSASVEKLAYLDELDEKGFDMFDRRTESALEDAFRFATLSQQCLAKEERLSSGMEKMSISLRVIDILDLIDDILIQKNLCEARRALYRALFLKSQAIESQETIQMDVLYLALDAFKFAATVAEASKDIETEASALAQLALLYQKTLKMEQNAKRYAKQSISMANSLAPRIVTSTEWYKIASKVLQDYQMKYMRMDEEEKRKLQEKYKTDIKTARDILEPLKSSPAELLKKVYEKYPPHTGTLDKTKLSPGADLRKSFQVAVTQYHPDKQLGGDEKTYVLFSEISKIMNSGWMSNFK